MTKVITYSRVFPAYHPKAGMPTYFIEKIWDSLGSPSEVYYCNLVDEYMNYLRLDDAYIWPKYHTIRNGNRWKVGDKLSPRVWSGKPYNSKQIVIAPDIEIKKVYDFSKDLISKDFYLNGVAIDSETLCKIAKNDGLELTDLMAWFQFPKPFNAQIICWGDVEY